MMQGDPKFMRRVNGWLTIFWIVMIPIAYFAGWLESVTFVSAISLWALVSGHWSAWQAARVEVEQRREKKEDTEGKMIKRIVKETNIKRVQSKMKVKSKSK
jgi:uncharacterized protein involved in cysteine biosynthesis